MFVLSMQYFSCKTIYKKKTIHDHLFLLSITLTTRVKLRPKLPYIMPFYSHKIWPLLFTKVDCILKDYTCNISLWSWKSFCVPNLNFQICVHCVHFVQISSCLWKWMTLSITCWACFSLFLSVFEYIFTAANMELEQKSNSNPPIFHILNQYFI